MLLLLTAATGATRGEPPAAIDEGRELGKYLAQHGYGVERVDNGGNNAQLVEPCVNGKRVRMMIDTGCDQTCLARSCAQDLGLEVHAIKGEDTGVAGKVSGARGAAVLKSFTLDGYEINRTNIIKVLSENAVLHNDGLLGYDYLRLNAVILPVGASFFLFKPGAMPVPSFDSFMVQMGYQPVPLTYGRGGLRVDGTLNGHAFAAIVDCGCAYSLFDTDFVTKTAGAGLMGTGFTVGGVDGRRLYCYLFVPGKFSIGSLALGQDKLTAAAGSILPECKAQALFGYDLLAEHKAIIDLGHNVLWMK
jgi:predicted aspartyl protease